MDPKLRKTVLRLISNGLFVLTSRGDDDGVGAATVSWVTQVSMKPPLIGASLKKNTGVHRCVAHSRRGILHVVDDSQVDLAKSFFRETVVVDGALNGHHAQVNEVGIPILDSARAVIDLELERIVDFGGDHDLYIFRPIGVELRQQTKPLTVAASPWEYGG